MSLSIDRLRVWLLVGAALLVLVIAGFLGYARYRTHRFLAGLPARLGVDIRRETNGYTYSQSVKGKTVMTLHAARAVEHKNGTLTLHDVGMILYGRKHDRADRISGSEFEYDQATGVVRAVGEVHIDLEAPAAAPRSKDSAASGAPSTVPRVGEELGEDNRRVIHVRTSGLVYIQKLAVAATDQDLEFKFGGMTGHATGAEYNADTGVLILQAAVRASAIQHGRPVVLTAAHAELERASQQARLTQARYVSPGQAMRGDHVVVYLRSDGSPERIEAEGDVTLEGAGSRTVTAPRADVLLNAAGGAQGAHLFGAGGVHYAEAGSLREGKGQAGDAQVAFDAAGRPASVVLTGAVHVNERVRSSDAAVPWSVRDATAGRMTFALAHEGGGGPVGLRQMDASEAAHVVLMSGVGTPGPATSELSGDTLRGRFSGTGKLTLLSHVHAVGHTALLRLGEDGAEQTSGGETLDVDLRPASKAKSKQGTAAGPGRGEEIAKAVQTGHVVLTSRPARKPGEPVPPTTRATADLGVYDGEADDLTLTGHAQVAGEGSTVMANRIVMEHGSGDAMAEGAVKANYLQPNSAEPVHVLADRAEMKHASGRAVFYGAPGPGGGAQRAARLWQGGSQVEAPVLEFDQEKRSLMAHGEVGEAAPVHAVLVGNSAARPAGTLRASVVRIASQTMSYLDVSRKVEFAGGVKVESTDGTLRAREATAFLQPAPAGAAGSSKGDPGKAAAAGGFFGGSVERIVANGKIDINQPGRRASGERLVYTASDGMFVLTGAPGALPKLIDEAQGTVTGMTLRFHTGDDSVMVGNGNGSGSAHTSDQPDAPTQAGVPVETNAGQRVHTVTRVKRK